MYNFELSRKMTHYWLSAQGSRISRHIGAALVNHTGNAQRTARGNIEAEGTCQLAALSQPDQAGNSFNRPRMPFQPRFVQHDAVMRAAPTSCFSAGQVVPVGVDNFALPQLIGGVLQAGVFCLRVSQREGFRRAARPLADGGHDIGQIYRRFFPIFGSLHSPGSSQDHSVNKFATSVKAQQVDDFCWRARQYGLRRPWHRLSNRAISSQSIICTQSPRSKFPTHW